MIATLEKMTLYQFGKDTIVDSLHYKFTAHQP